MTLQFFHCVNKNKHLPSLFSLRSFVIINFIKTIARTTQIHQPITFDYFEHQPITDKWSERVTSAHVRDRTLKTIFVAEKFEFSGKEVFSGERFTIKELFYTSYNMAISVQNLMLNMNYYL